MSREPATSERLSASEWLLRARARPPVQREFADSGIWIALDDVWRGFLTWPIWARVAQQDIAMRYKRSLIGPFWISLSLAAMIVGMAMLYSQIFNSPFKEYLTWLAVSMLCWNYLSITINESCGVLTDEGLLRALPVSITGLAGRVMMRNAIIFFHNLLTVAVMLIIFQVPIHLSALYAIPGILVYGLLGVLLGMMLGPICLRYRDVAQLIANFMQIAFFLTPIVWRPNQLGHRIAIVDANPLYQLLEIVRAPILGETIPQHTWVYVGLTISVCAILAFVIIAASRRRVFMWM